MSVGYVYDPIYVAHDRAGHPERASRLTAIMAHLESSGLIQLLKAIPAEAASIEDLGRIHSLALIEQVRQMAQSGGGIWIWTPMSMLLPTRLLSVLREGRSRRRALS